MVDTKRQKMKEWIMGTVMARLMQEDGKYHYGVWTLPAPHLGRLFGISATGDAELPTFPPNPATEAEYQQWLAELKRRGLCVNVVTLDERVP